MVWSRGLRDAVGLGVEATDVEVVETDQGGDELRPLGSAWSAFSLASKAVRVLEAAEADDTGEALDLFLRGCQARATSRRWFDQYDPPTV